MADPDKKLLIAIGRQYGSNGRIIGRMIAELLGIGFYDKELIALAASESGLNSQLLSLVDEEPMNVYMEASSAAAAAMRGDDSDKDLSLNDQLYLAQSDVIERIAAEGSAVLVGRTADHILRNEKALFTVFVHAPLNARILTVMERSGLSREKAERRIQTEDRHRAQYYERHTGFPWGQLERFDLAIDSSILGPEETAAHIANFMSAVVKRRGLM